MAESLIAADYMGHRFHKLPSTVANLLSSKDAAPTGMVLEMEGRALVDGRSVPGPVLANYCMVLALQKASTMGIGRAAALVAKDNMFGVCMSKAVPPLMPAGALWPFSPSFLSGLGTRKSSSRTLGCQLARWRIWRSPTAIAVYTRCHNWRLSMVIAKRNRIGRPWGHPDLGIGYASAACCEKNRMPIVPDNEISHMESVDDQGGHPSCALAVLKELPQKLSIEPRDCECYCPDPTASLDCRMSVKL